MVLYNHINRWIESIYVSIKIHVSIKNPLKSDLWERSPNLLFQLRPGKTTTWQFCLDASQAPPTQHVQSKTHKIPPWSFYFSLSVYTLASNITIFSVQNLRIILRFHLFLLPMSKSCWFYFLCIDHIRLLLPVFPVCTLILSAGVLCLRYCSSPCGRLRLRWLTLILHPGIHALVWYPPLRAGHSDLFLMARIWQKR